MNVVLRGSGKPHYANASKVKHRGGSYISGWSTEEIRKLLLFSK